MTHNKNTEVPGTSAGNAANEANKKQQSSTENTIANLGSLAGAAASTDTTEYIVKKGDTLSAIGKKHGVKWQRIYEANKDIIKDPDLIQPGWKLRIPSK
ncbi:MAG: LysM peptidoglycan-binding domain-containing protein [Chitinophagaceae bacterium]|nr:LysM peptidoglycan-binding domain-containing protein [Chitinophagaceae bacterium]